MTANRRPGRVVTFDQDEFFARGPDDELLHVHDDFNQGRFGSSERASLTGDPITIQGTDGQRHIFARGRSTDKGGMLLHWKVNSTTGKVTGPFNHHWRIAYDPVAVALPGGAIELYARGANDELIRWLLPATGDPGPPESLGGSVSATPAAVLRENKTVTDVFAVAADGTLNWRGEQAQGSWFRIGSGATGSPVAVSWAAKRLDVLTPGSEGSARFLTHWGFDEGNGNQLVPLASSDPASPDPERVRIRGSWFGPDTSDLGTVESLSCAVVVGPKKARVFARGTDGQLVQWHWDGEDVAPTDVLGWKGPETIGPAASAPAAFGGGNPFVYAWVGEGRTLVRFVQRAGTLTWDADEQSIEWPVGDDQPPARTFEVDIDVVLSRPADLMRAGIGWSGFSVVDGDPPLLQPVVGQTPRLRIVLPPQHIGEEVAGAQDVVPPGAQFQSVLSGVSQLTLTFAEPVSAIPLTPEGLLRAARTGVIEADDASAATPVSFVELPWQMFVSPDGATLEHDASAPSSGDVAVPLWRTRIRSSSGDLSILTAGTEDSFTVPLGASDRAALASQGPPAQVDRLELSSLGGTLRANGSWSALDWQHEATLGRDGRVRTDTRGILYPYGHHAVLTTITERDLTDPATPEAVLRQQTFLTVTEATITRPADDEELARAFPFDAVTITTRRFDHVTAGDPVFIDRPAIFPDAVAAQIAAAQDQLAGLPRVVDGWPGAPIPDEVAVMFTGPFDTVQSNQRELAEQRIGLIEEIQRLTEVGHAVQELHKTSILQYFTPIFTPKAGGAWIAFPVTCQLGAQVLSFTTPMVFVNDEQRPPTPTNPAFDSLADGDVQAEVAKRWVTMRPPGDTTLAATVTGAPADRDEGYAGLVHLAGQSLDLLGTGAAEDRQLVNRIYVSAQAAGRGFRPRLGPDAVLAALPGEHAQPPWALDLTLPSMSTLLPGRTEAHRVVTTFSKAYLDTGTAEIVHDIVGPAAGVLDKHGKVVDAAGDELSEVRGLVVDFTKDAERSGGLAAPKMVTDGLSRIAGPVNVAGLTSLDPKGLLDPKALLAAGTDGAKLLGFSLADLLGPLSRDDLPTITTDLSGPQPVVTMLWPPNPPDTPPEQRRRQELTPGPGGAGAPGGATPFGLFRIDDGDPPYDPAHPDRPPPRPSMAMEVRASGPQVRTECTVEAFSIAFPPQKPLLTLNFKRVRYVQEAGRPPALTVEGLDAKFSDELDILTALEKKIGLGDQGPTIRVVDDSIVAAYALAIPDASSGAFVMRNLLFSVSLTVPFRGDPVVVALGFASKAKPFNLSVMMFGGGGYVDLEFDHTGLRRMDIALEFGAAIAVDFVIAKGEAHVLGGIRFELRPGPQPDSPKTVALVGYLRIGGSLEVLGLVTVSVELVLSLGYESTGNRLVGRATLVLELDLTIWSDKVELDSGEWVIAGGEQQPAEEILPGTPDGFLDLFRQHRNAFRAVPQELSDV